MIFFVDIYTRLTPAVEPRPRGEHVLSLRVSNARAHIRNTHIQTLRGRGRGRGTYGDLHKAFLGELECV